MKRKPVVPREAANRDVEAVLDHYVSEGAHAAARGFVDALQVAYRHISLVPASGSLRYAHDLGLRGLRAWPLQRYPHIVFYVERDDHVDVWRVLHGERDIPKTLKIETTRVRTVR